MTDGTLSLEAPSGELAELPLVERNGSTLLLSLVRADGTKLSIILGTGEAVAVASELLLAARLRMARADWPPRPEGGD